MKATGKGSTKAPFKVGETVLCSWRTNHPYNCPAEHCWLATIVDVKRNAGYESGWAVSATGSAHGATGPLDSPWFRKVPKTAAVGSAPLTMTADEELRGRRDSFAGNPAAMRPWVEIDALREARRTDTERIRREECNRCVAAVSRAADDARISNRKKAAAELDMLARDMADAREVQ